MCGLSDVLSGVLTGGLSTGINAIAGGNGEVTNSFGTLGLSDLFKGNGFNPLDLGKSAFQWTDDRMGTGSMNQDIGNLINLVALAYGGISAGSALGGLFSGSAAVGEGAGAAGMTAAEGAAGATSLAPLETAAAITPTVTGEAATAAGTISPYAAMYSGGGGAGLMGLSTEAALPTVTGLAETGTMGTAAAGLGTSAAGAGSSGILDTLGSVGSGALNLAKAHPLLSLMALNAGSQLLSSKGQQDAVDANKDYYNQTAYPNTAKVNSQSASAYSNLASQIAQAKLQAEEDYAKRGMKAGSLGGVYSKIDSAAQKSYAQLANELIQYQNTPFYAPSSGTNQTNTTTGTLANSLNGLTGTLGSMYLYKDLFNS
ncbi:MAG: hypothetical protein WC332_00030 [Clostridia bacterium]|jgi:hypothetical protein